MPSNHLILCWPLLLPPSIFPSIRVFSNESVLCIMWPKYWSFSFTISPSNECSGLISSRMDWMDLLIVQATPKSLLQHHSSKASIVQRSAFFIVQLSHWKINQISNPLAQGLLWWSSAYDSMLPVWKGPIPGQETRPHTLQLSSHAARKTWCRKIDKSVF